MKVAGTSQADAFTLIIYSQEFDLSKYITT